MKKTNNFDEIDLVAILKILWQGKWIIFFAVFIASFATIVLYQLQPKNITLSSGITKVKVYNNNYKKIDFIYDKLFKQEKGLNFIKLSPQSLLDLYLENLVTYEVVEKAASISNLFKNQNYSAIDYQNKIQSIINSIKIFNMTVLSQKQGSVFEKLFYEYKLDFFFNELEKGRLFLINLDKVANEKVRNIIVQNFNQNISSFKYLAAITLAEIEDRIQMELYSHEQKKKERIEFLKEQALLARALEISKITDYKEKLSVGNFSITDSKMETPYYFRGYESIEKEIELIKARVNPGLFSEGIIELEKQKKYLRENKNLNNLQFVFNNSDINKKEKFIAAEIFELESKINSNFIQVLLIAIFISLILSFVFILTRQSFKK